MNAKKKAEAAAHVKEAEKALKTSLMKWTPDHDSAGDSYSKAATCYKVAKCHDEALDCLNKACENYKEVRQLYQAAKMLEQSVLICRDSNRTDQIAGLAERGGLLYRQHGSPESAAQLLEKSAKIMESRDPTTALELYEKAAETIMVEDRPKQAAEYMVKVGRLQVKAKLWDKATNTLEETVRLMQESGSTASVGKVVVGLVLVQLVREDVVAAQKAFSAWGGYCDGDQTSAVNTLLTGFNDEDGDVVKQALNSGAIKNLDVEFTIMAKKDIQIPEGGGGLEAAAAEFGAQRAAVASATKASAVSAAAASSSSGGAGTTTGEHSFGVDPVSASDLGETKEQREEEARQQRELEEEEDDEDALC